MYILPIMYCLVIALDEHMFSHNGYGPVTKALVLSPGPISVVSEHLCIKGSLLGNQ